MEQKIYFLRFEEWNMGGKFEFKYFEIDVGKGSLI